MFTTVEMDVDLSDVASSKFGDFHAGALSAKVNTGPLNDFVVKVWLDRAQGRSEVN